MPKHQYSLSLIQHNANGSLVEQRLSDGYINATALCKAASARWNDYFSNDKSKAFFNVASAKTGIPVLELNQKVTVGGVHSIWVHPKVAIHLGQWLSAEFAYQVAEWVHDWMSGKGSPKEPASLPYHLKRHMANQHKLPTTHFSILQEMTMSLIAPLEAQGYTLPESMVPDISQGLMFCAFLRKHGLADPSLLPTYEHEFPDGRVVDAKLYPFELLAAFRTFVAEVWLPQKAKEYFAPRDPAALPYLDNLLMLPAPKPTPPKPANSRSFKRKA